MEVGGRTGKTSVVTALCLLPLLREVKAGTWALAAIAIALLAVERLK